MKTLLFILFTGAIIVIIMACFGGYYRKVSGIIGLFKCVTKALIHSNKSLAFHDKNIYLSLRLIVMLEQKKQTSIRLLLANLGKCWSDRAYLCDISKIGNVKFKIF